MRGRNSSADLGPGLREQRHKGLFPIQQFWPKAINPGGLEAEPPVQRRSPSNCSLRRCLASRQARCAASPRRLRRQVIGGILGDQVWTIPDGHAPIEVFVNDNRLSS
jgi:hypothetical protein